MSLSILSNGGIPKISIIDSFRNPDSASSEAPEVGERRSPAHLEDVEGEKEVKHPKDDTEDPTGMAKYSSCKAGNQSGDGEAGRPIERGSELPKAASMMVMSSGNGLSSSDESRRDSFTLS